MPSNSLKIRSSIGRPIQAHQEVLSLHTKFRQNMADRVVPSAGLGSDRIFNSIDMVPTESRAVETRFWRKSDRKSCFRRQENPSPPSYQPPFLKKGIRCRMSVGIPTDFQQNSVGIPSESIGIPSWSLGVSVIIFDKFWIKKWALPIYNLYKTCKLKPYNHHTWYMNQNHSNYHTWLHSFK